MMGGVLPDVDDAPAPRAPRAGILVVDDDADYRAAVSDVLEEEGYRVETAIHGRDALGRLLAGPPPDLIVLDLMMPEMDGWALMAELNARPALGSIPIVVTSAVGSWVPQSASTRFLTKPVDRTRLLQTISSCLWRRSQEGASSRFARVLVVDDDVILGRTIARLLTWDHDVVAVTTAAEALSRIGAGERFDAILSDLHMAGMTGMDLHARLAEDVPDQAARMVFMTGDIREPEAREFLARGTARWIEKPFGMTELRALIQLQVESAAGQDTPGSSA
jgi:CheY-like chemotaxis protein